MFKDEEEASDVVQKLLPKKRNLQFTLPPPNSPDSRRFSLEPTLNYLEVPVEKSPLIHPWRNLMHDFIFEIHFMICFLSAKLIIET